VKETEKLLEGRENQAVWEYRPDIITKEKFFCPGKRGIDRIQYRGYDKSRDCQRYGFHPRYHDRRIFRIPLKTDPKIFTKVARNSKK